MSTTAPRLPIHALNFDMDGLFIDSESLAGEAIAALVRWYGREDDLDAEADRRLTGTRMRDFLAVVSNMCGQGLSCDALARKFQELGLTLLPDLLQPTPGAAEPIAVAPEISPPLAPMPAGVRRVTDAVLAETRRTRAFSVEITREDAALAAIGYPASSHSSRGG